MASTRKIPLGTGDNTIWVEPVAVFNSQGELQTPGSVEFESDPDNPLYTANVFNSSTIETLSTPSTTSTPFNVSNKSRVTCQYTVSSINTSVLVRLEGTCDGNNWFNLDPYDYDTNITADGTYAFILTDVALHSIRFNFLSEVGGTNANISILIGAN